MSASTPKKDDAIKLLHYRERWKQEEEGDGWIEGEINQKSVVGNFFKKHA